LTSGDQVGIEKSMYLSLCRVHWEEETGRWPLPVPAKSAKPKRAAAKAPARKKAKPGREVRPALRVAAARTQQPPRRRQR
jgi:hypothetical protein